MIQYESVMKASAAIFFNPLYKYSIRTTDFCFREYIIPACFFLTCSTHSRHLYPPATSVRMELPELSWY